MVVDLLIELPTLNAVGLSPKIGRKTIQYMSSVRVSPKIKHFLMLRLDVCDRLIVRVSMECPAMMGC